MRRLRHAGGFTYLTILIVVAIMGVGLALAGEVWHSAAMREREAQLLHVGEQYRRAIERYVLAGPRQYPRTLAELLRDARKPGVERYLRRLYPDPVTNSDDWGLVKAPDGGVMGVYSRSEAKPIKQARFRLPQAAFEGAQKYSDWKFVFVPAGQPGAQTRVPKPAAQPGAANPAGPAAPQPAPGARP
jgi:type II secretory pathway pseudopilin PulG